MHAGVLPHEQFCDRPRHACRKAGTISVRAAWIAGAIPASVPAAMETIRPINASRTEGVKAIVTASAPTES